MKAMLAKAGLNSLAKTSADTNKTYIDLNTKIANRTLFMGPVRVTKLPRVKWDR